MVTSHRTRMVESAHKTAHHQSQLSLDSKLSMPIVLHISASIHTAAIITSVSGKIHVSFSYTEILIL